MRSMSLRRVSEVVITRRTRNAVVPQGARGFESHTLRSKQGPAALSCGRPLILYYSFDYSLLFVAKVRPDVVSYTSADMKNPCAWLRITAANVTLTVNSAQAPLRHTRGSA